MMLMCSCQLLKKIATRFWLKGWQTKTNTNYCPWLKSVKWSVWALNGITSDV